MRKSNLVVVDKTEKGLIWGKVKDSETIFQLSPKGKLQVSWENLEQKIEDFETIKSNLVPNEGEELFVKPEFQHLKSKIPYPKSILSIKLHWCNESYQYHKAIVNPYLSKRERKLLNLDVEYLELLLKMLYQVKEEPGSLFGTPLTLIYKS